MEPTGNIHEFKPEVSEPEEERVEPRVELPTTYGLESYSFGAVLREMIHEEPVIPEPIFTKREVPEMNERKALQEYIKDILKELRHNSDIIELRLKVKNEGYESLSRPERKTIIGIYDSIKGRSLEHHQGKKGFPKKLGKRIRSDLNYTLRSAILEGAEPQDWMVLDPSLRKVDLLDKKTLLRYLKNSLNPSGDIKFIREEIKKGTATKDMIEVDKTVQKNPKVLESEKKLPEAA